MHPVLHLRGTVVPGFGRGSRELGERLQCRVDKPAGHPVCRWHGSRVASPVELCSLLGRLSARLLISIDCLPPAAGIPTANLDADSLRGTLAEAVTGEVWGHCMPCITLHAGWLRC